ncbi:heavy-metal-associated domain-containing protein [Kineococcus glutinatus]|uniref:Heavy-metal-associated domain-containing protein n=1 Tax=Kineococcus glutinatus TaxID=1070872 RepID=A0ABP8VF48_9ACTN
MSTPAPTATYAVTGMTCAHCVGAVTEEVSRVPGVTAVDVDLATGRLTVTGSPAPGQAPDEAAVRAAVEEAGYRLTGA